MKLYIYVINAEAALAGDLNWSLTVSTRKDLATNVNDNWFLVGEVDADINLDSINLSGALMGEIEKQKNKLKADLAITYHAES